MPKQYTDRETREIVELYEAHPNLETVDMLCVKFNRTRKSIIAKLSKEGVYQTKGYRTKRGEVPISKLEMVRQIEDALDDKFPGLDKTPKDTLKALKDHVLEVTYLLDNSLNDIYDLRENQAILKEIIGTKNRSIENVDLHRITTAVDCKD